jgi:hypothetical protein
MLRTFAFSRFRMAGKIQYVLLIQPPHGPHRKHRFQQCLLLRGCSLPLKHLYRAVASTACLLRVRYSGFHPLRHNITQHNRYSLGQTVQPLPCRPSSLWNAAISTFPTPPSNRQSLVRRVVSPALTHKNSPSPRGDLGFL